MLSGNVARDIKMSYTGGAIELYKPKPLNDSKIYYYDANSLYPYIIANKKMPIGAPIYFEGDITKLEIKPYGFFYCKIIAPDKNETSNITNSY